MALACPYCGGRVAGEAVDIPGDDGVCPHCDARFKVSDALPLEDARDTRAPPPDVVYVEETPGGGINVLLPAPGLRGRAIGIFVFAAFWDALVVTITALMIGSFFQAEPDANAPGLLGLLFMLPFWAVGIGFPLWGLWMAFGTTAVRLGPEGATTIKQLFGRTWTRQYSLQELEPFSQDVAYRENYQPVHACVLRCGKKSVYFGHHLAGPDQEWLIGRLNEARARLLGEEKGEECPDNATGR